MQWFNRFDNDEKELDAAMTSLMTKNGDAFMNILDDICIHDGVEHCKVEEIHGTMFVVAWTEDLDELHYYLIETDSETYFGISEVFAEHLKAFKQP